ncbi:hypothetical protein BVY03_03930 [bacterium K02(2017)]|nr:hypothetical protein BVY03_03930 [bacterium K02(2017)]
MTLKSIFGCLYQPPIKLVILFLLISNCGGSNIDSITTEYGDAISNSAQSELTLTGTIEAPQFSALPTYLKASKNYNSIKFNRPAIDILCKITTFSGKELGEFITDQNGNYNITINKEKLNKDSNNDNQILLIDCANGIKSYSSIDNIQIKNSTKISLETADIDSTISSNFIDNLKENAENNIQCLNQTFKSIWQQAVNNEEDLNKDIANFRQIIQIYIANNQINTLLLKQILFGDVSKLTWETINKESLEWGSQSFSYEKYQNITNMTDNVHGIISSLLLYKNNQNCNSINQGILNVDVVTKPILSNSSADILNETYLKNGVKEVHAEILNSCLKTHDCESIKNSGEMLTSFFQEPNNIQNYIASTQIDEKIVKGLVALTKVCKNNNKTSSKNCIKSKSLELNEGQSNWDKIISEGSGNKRIIICHYPPGNIENAHEISISETALEIHLNHGDNKGICELEDDNSEDNREDDVVIVIVEPDAENLPEILEPIVQDNTNGCQSDQLSFNLDNAAGYIQYANNIELSEKFRKILTTGKIERFFCGPIDIIDFYLAPWGKTYIQLSKLTSYYNENGSQESCQLIEVSPDNSYSCIDNTNLKIQRAPIYKQESKPLVFKDDSGILYYLGHDNQGFVIRTWDDEKHIDYLFDSHIYINDYSVANDGMLYLAGYTLLDDGTVNAWIRSINENGKIETLTKDKIGNYLGGVFWIKKFPDNNIYSSIYYPFQGIVKIDTNLKEFENKCYAGNYYFNYYYCTTNSIYGYSSPANNSYPKFNAKSFYHDSNKNVFGIFGRSYESKKLWKVYPSVSQIDIPDIKDILLASITDNKVVFAGADNQNKYRFKLYDIPTKSSIDLLPNTEIEIYQTKILPNGDIWFAGLRMTDMLYVIGSVNTKNNNQITYYLETNFPIEEIYFPNNYELNLDTDNTTSNSLTNSQSSNINSISYSGTQLSDNSGNMINYDTQLSLQYDNNIVCNNDILSFDLSDAEAFIKVNNELNQKIGYKKVLSDGQIKEFICGTPNINNLEIAKNGKVYLILNQSYNYKDQTGSDQTCRAFEINKNNNSYRCIEETYTIQKINYNLKFVPKIHTDQFGSIYFVIKLDNKSIIRRLHLNNTYKDFILNSNDRITDLKITNEGNIFYYGYTTINHGIIESNWIRSFNSDGLHNTVKIYDYKPRWTVQFPDQNIYTFSPNKNLHGIHILDPISEKIKNECWMGLKNYTCQNGSKLIFTTTYNTTTPLHRLKSFKISNNDKVFGIFGEGNDTKAVWEIYPNINKVVIGSLNKNVLTNFFKNKILSAGEDINGKQQLFLTDLNGTNPINLLKDYNIEILQAQLIPGGDLWFSGINQENNKNISGLIQTGNNNKIIFREKNSIPILNTLYYEPHLYSHNNLSVEQAPYSIQNNVDLTETNTFEQTYSKLQCNSNNLSFDLTNNVGIIKYNYLSQANQPYKKIMHDGTISDFICGNLNIKDIQTINSELYLILNKTSSYIDSNNITQSCNLFKIKPDNSYSCLNNFDINITRPISNYTNQTPLIQKDMANSIYFMGHINSSYHILKYDNNNETTKNYNLGSNIKLINYIVSNDSYIYLYGYSIASDQTKQYWIRSISPSGQLTTLHVFSISHHLNVTWMKMFPDNNIYIGSPVENSGILKINTSTHLLENKCWATFNPYQTQSACGVNNVVGFSAPHFTTSPERFSYHFYTNSKNSMYGLFDPYYNKSTTGNHVWKVYPTVEKLSFSTKLSSVNHLNGYGDNIIVAGSDVNSDYRILLRNTITGNETNLLPNTEIIVHHTKFENNGKIWFIGLRFQDNKSVMGVIDTTNNNSITFYKQDNFPIESFE